MLVLIQHVSPYRDLITQWTSNDDPDLITYSDYLQKLDRQLRAIVSASQKHLDHVVAVCLLIRQLHLREGAMCSFLILVNLQIS